MVKNGKRKLKYRSDVQKWLCKRCGRSASETNFPRMKFPKNVVESSVELYHDGLTLERTRRRASKIFNMLIKSASTIWYWAKRFMKSSRRIIQGLAELLHADETMLKTHKKGRFFWFWAVKCPKTKAIVGWHLSEHRTLRDAKLLFWEARRRFPPTYSPKAIRTDSFPGYRFAIMRVFNHRVEHDRVKSFKHGNNVIENFFRHKRRFPRFRDLESARKYLAHWVSEYNSSIISFLWIFHHTKIEENLK